MCVSVCACVFCGVIGKLFVPWIFRDKTMDDESLIIMDKNTACIDKNL